jgi:hypothetical protein
MRNNESYLSSQQHFEDKINARDEQREQYNKQMKEDYDRQMEEEYNKEMEKEMREEYFKEQYYNETYGN